MLHVASTSDTPEQVDAVLNGTTEPAPTPDPSPEPQATDGALAAPVTEPHSPEPPPDAGRAPHQSRAEKRIAKERALRGEAERERDAERTRLTDLQRQFDEFKKTVAAPAAAAPAAPVADPTAPVREPAAQPDAPGQFTKPEPKIDQFETVDEYNSAHAAWVREGVAHDIDARLNARDAADRDRVARETATREEFAARTAFASRAIEFKKSRPDYDTVVTSAPSDLTVTPIMERTIITSPHGPAIAYYLGQHHEEFREISALHPIDQAIRLGEIVAAVKVAPRSGSTPRAQVTAAPEPPSAGAGTGRVTPNTSIERIAERPNNLAAFKAARAAGR